MTYYESQVAQLKERLKKVTTGAELTIISDALLDYICMWCEGGIESNETKTKEV